MPTPVVRFLVGVTVACSLGVTTGDDLPPDRTPVLTVDGDGFAGTPATAIAISDDGAFLAAANDTVIRVFELPEGQLHSTFRGYQEQNGSGIGSIESLAFSPKGRYLVAGVNDNTDRGSTRIFDLQRSDKLHALLPGQHGSSSHIGFSPDGRWLGTYGCSRDHLIYRWDQNTGNAKLVRKVQNLSRDRADDTPQQAIDRRAVIEAWVTDADDEELQQLSKAEIHDIATGTMDGLCKADSPVNTFTSDGRFVETVGGWLLDLHDPKLPLVPRSRVPSRYFDRDKAKKLQADGFKVVWFKGSINTTNEVAPRRGMPYALRSMIASGPQPVYRIGLWTVGNDEPTRQFPMRYETTAFRWNLACGLIAAADALGQIRVWSIETGKRVTTINSGARQIWNVTWDDTGRRLRFTATPYRAGKFHYNRFGGVSHQFDVSKLILREDQDGAQDKSETIRTPWGRVSTYERKEINSGKGQPQLLDGRSPVLGHTLKITYPNGSDEWLDPYGSHDRINAVDNPNLVLSPGLGKPMSFTCSSYEDCDEPRIFLGTDKGHLIEATYVIDATGAGTLQPVRKFVGHTATVTGIAVSPHGRYLASSSLDGTIRLWRLDRPRVLADVPFFRAGSTIVHGPPFEHYERLTHFADSSFFGRYRALTAGLYEPGENVLVRAINWSGQTREAQVQLMPAPDVALPLWSLFWSRQDEWVAWTKEGYYASSSDGARHVGWHVNNDRAQLADYYRVDQFGERFHNRQLVMDAVRLGSSTKAIALEPNHEVKDTFYASTLSPVPPNSVAKQLPPRIQLADLNRDPAQESHWRFRFDVEHAGDRRPTEFQIVVNGRPVSRRADLIETKDQSDGSLSSYVADFDYESSIRNALVYVTDSAGMSDRRVIPKSDLPTVSVLKLPPVESNETPEERRVFLLSIGVSDYEQARLDLGHAANDATRFAAAFQRRLMDSGHPVESKVITNQQASKEHIEDAMHWLVESSRDANDLAVVFLAGHGLLDRDGDWFFAGHDCDIDNLYKSGLSFALLELQFNKIQSNLILFTDTCHASHLTTSLTPHRRYPRSSRWQRGQTLTYAACLPEEESIEHSNWKHGAFTKALLEFLSDSQDSNRDGRIEFAEMEAFVNHRVKELTGDRQHPASHRPQGTGQFVLFDQAR